MDYIVNRICQDIIKGCQDAGILCDFWTNVEITAKETMHGVESVKVTIPLYVPTPTDG